MTINSNNVFHVKKEELGGIHREIYDLYMDGIHSVPNIWEIINRTTKDKDWLNANENKKNFIIDEVISIIYATNSWNLMNERLSEEDSFKLLYNPNLFKIITEEGLDDLIKEEYNSRKAIFLTRCAIWVKGIQMNTFVSAESSSGKDYIVSKILEMFPEEKTEKRTKITPQAFNYWHNSEKEPNWTWDGKNCYLQDISESVLNSPTFKCMASEGSNATIVINGAAVDLKINGRPNIIITTAESNPTNEIMNRFLFIQLDESEDQTKAVMEYIAEKSETGIKRRVNQNIRYALSLLNEEEVIIPFAKKLVKYFPRTVKMRRTFEAFLNVIKCSAVLYQYQRRASKDGKLIAIKKDYDIATEIMKSISGNTLPGITARERRHFEKFKSILRGKLGKKESLPMNEEILEISLNVPEIVNAAGGFSATSVWYEILPKLCSKNMIQEESIKNDYGKYVKHYKLIKDKNTKGINLPEFNKL